ncbi:hypothetical protein F5882DRAFT_445742 [Hyaloscypha sp. PMI_1271]|nr:hypothetical protein F5882DRAFT_445742 [Hyaloscypha sp. PMI_1271]
MACAMPGHDYLEVIRQIREIMPRNTSPLPACHRAMPSPRTFVLDIPYHELFTTSTSPVYASLKVVDSKVVRILRDEIEVKKLRDLKELGIRDLNVPEFNRTITNSSMPKAMFETCLGRGTATSNKLTGGQDTTKVVICSWKDIGSMFFKDAAELEDLIQGALGDYWLIAALSAVIWVIPKWYF